MTRITEITLPCKDGYAHMACPDCGNVFMLPWREGYEPAWCLHEGHNYSWPETHWEGGAEKYPDWREQWIGYGWTEMLLCQVTITPQATTTSLRRTS